MCRSKVHFGIAFKSKPDYYWVWHNDKIHHANFGSFASICESINFMYMWQRFQFADSSSKCGAANTGRCKIDKWYMIVRAAAVAINLYRLARMHIANRRAEGRGLPWKWQTELNDFLPFHQFLITYFYLYYASWIGLRTELGTCGPTSTWNIHSHPQLSTEKKKLKKYLK